MPINSSHVIAPQPRFTMSRVLKRWWTLNGSNRFLVIEAFGALLMARVFIAVLPFRVIVKLLGGQSNQRGLDISPDLSVEDSTKSNLVTWSITAVSRHTPWVAACYPKCLTAAWMLRRRKIPYRIYFGLKKNSVNGKGVLLAHSWVEVQHRTIFGEQQGHGFTKLICISK